MMGGQGSCRDPIEFLVLGCSFGRSHDLTQEPELTRDKPENHVRSI